MTSLSFASEITYAQAIREALTEEMERDPRVIIMGEDVGVLGGVYRVTKGLFEKFGPARVIDTPISEEGFTGAAIGAAISGLKPVVEIMYADFLPCCSNQIVNLAAKMRYLTAGALKVPVVIRTPLAWHYEFGHGGDHAQTLISQFANVPGLLIVAPSTPYDAKGLLKSSIREERPTIFYESGFLYSTKGNVPSEEYAVQLGKADIKRSGDDVTLVTFSFMIHEALRAAQDLERDGVSVEVIDPRTIVPLDGDTLAKSVEKTGRLVVVDPSHKTCGVGAELLSTIVEKAFDCLDAPPVRVAALDVPIPSTICKLHKLIVPNKDSIVAAVKKLVR
jgi:pyruvate/2-oxoglutarate/acetoin dehydrogenase E1 component